MKTSGSMEEILSLAKRRGFVFQGSEIYGGLANAWDYGPLGAEMKNLIKASWWESFVRKRSDVVGLDSAILMNPKTWEASGHLSGFSDPLMDCRNCKTRHRADKLLEDFFLQKKIDETVEGLTNEMLEKKIAEHAVPCPRCGKKEFTNIRQFNLMFKTFQGVTEESSSVVYLRPETAQGIFVNFKNVQTVSRKKIPFGIGQIGKSFRNEITPGNFIFRTREFEQMELEYFCKPENSLEIHESWIRFCKEWLLSSGINEELIRLRKHEKEELSHYSSATTDIEFLFPFGWGELWGIAHRGDYDLNQHQKFSGKDLSYFDPAENKKYVPHVIEPSLGTDRLFLAILCSAFTKDRIEEEERVLLKLSPQFAPIKAAILPLSKKLSESAEKLTEELACDFSVDYDDTGSIGKRYRRQDEIGTPYCITVDFDSQEDGAVTVRDRDTTSQERIQIEQIKSYLSDKLSAKSK